MVEIPLKCKSCFSSTAYQVFVVTWKDEKRGFKTWLLKLVCVECKHERLFKANENKLLESMTKLIPIELTEVKIDEQRT